MGIKKNNKPIVYDFFVDSPKINNQKIDFNKIDVDFGDTTQSFFIGKGSIAIPGTIAGLLDVQKEVRLSFSLFRNRKAINSILFNSTSRQIL